MFLNKKKIFVIIFLISIFTGIFMGVIFALTKDLPQIRKLEDFIPSAATKIYSSDNVLLAELFIEKRYPVSIKKMPYYLKAALIATEDKKFYKHFGFDIKGIFRAAVKNVIAGKFVEGASTITQQLAKTLFLTREKNLSRKLNEFVLSIQLERRYTKNEILEFYLNQVYFGSGAYGVESAAKIYFNRSVSELNLNQCALIAGMPKSPSRYSPLNNINMAKKRRNIVLLQMMQDKIITKIMYDNEVKQPVITVCREDVYKKAPFFVDIVKKQTETALGFSMLYKGGIKIHTTLSYKYQKIAEQSQIKHINNLIKRMRSKNIENPDPQGALVSIDTKTGAILAMTGGNDYQKSSYNRAVFAKRQSGSAFKPIIYAIAIEKGLEQNSKILDAPVVFKGSKKSNDWQPENFSRKYSGEITLRYALVHSKNIPAVKLIEKFGVQSVVSFAKRVGIQSKLAPYFSLALGSSETTLIEITSAYSIFPGSGLWIKPFYIKKITDRNDNTIWQNSSVSHIAMSDKGAAVMSDILKGVISEGTGRRAKSLKGFIAGKTGTTNNYKDALFIGFSSNIATGVWVGNDNYSSLGNFETGAKAALPIWIDFMKKVVLRNSDSYFNIPDGMYQKNFDMISGNDCFSNSINCVKGLFRTKH